MDLKKHTICYSGKAEGNKEYGVAFVIEQEFKSAIIDFKPMSERICTLRIRTTFFNMTLMNVHTLTEEKEEEVKDYFYQQMEGTYDSIPSNDIKVILRDLNTKTDKEKEYRGVIGTESLHDITNHNGINLIDFAESKNLIIRSTYFLQKNIHKRTWAAPDVVTFNQIDHVLMGKRFAMNILDVRTLRGANCDSDHYLVQVK
ncbi:craniofacial development protein 2-like [Cryptotermes secundus]|uniref:craniofacial development protein 2-like n=1 Tax=Cryptotermes secundus TaxID=105785 RepID=UPI000CD7D162|nr:craniofacial development protein 2-like [Cryptotermes secundus]